MRYIFLSGLPSGHSLDGLEVTYSSGDGVFT